MKLSQAGLYALICIALAVTLSCVSTPPDQPGTSLTLFSAPAIVVDERTEIEQLLALGGPSALEEAVSLAQSASGLAMDDTKAYIWMAYELARLVYPELSAGLSPRSDAPPGHPLVQAFVNARNGRVTPLPPDAGPLLTMMPVIGVFRIKSQEAYSAALVAAERYSRFGWPSAIVDMARGMALEASGDRTGAMAAFSSAEAAAPDCYTASIGKAGILIAEGRNAEALVVLSRIGSPANTSLGYRKNMALVLYESGNWPAALPMITAILLEDPLNARYMLMRAHLLVEQGDFRQAAPLLDAYAKVDALDRLYIWLRAKYAMEGSKDRGAALAVIRRGIERYPNDARLAIFAAELLAAGDVRERAESLVLASRALRLDPQSTRALILLFAADLASGNAEGAVQKADRILELEPDYDDYLSLYRAYSMAGRMNDAAAILQTWLARDPASEFANLAWLGILVDRGDSTAALDLIRRGLAGRGSLAYRSSLYWYQSRLQTNEEAVLASLRSALVENGMNIDALVALADIYIQKTDYQRARFYLRQAFSIAPDRDDVTDLRNTLAQFGVAIP
jgi:tetratricopeptide (TPR) repeat protein